MLLLEHFGYSVRVNNRNHLQNIITGFCEDHDDAKTYKETRDAICFPLLYKDFYIVARPDEAIGTSAARLLMQIIRRNNNENETRIEPKLILFSDKGRRVCMIYSESRVIYNPEGTANETEDNQK